MLKNNKSKTSTYRQDEEEIKRDCERERDGSFLSISLPPSFEIVRIFVD